MDCTKLEYMDNSFDTVVDTFGLQSSYDYKMQFEEMKRVCKVGGKILLLEIGESLWKTTNFKIIQEARNEFLENGQHLYRNWDTLILNDPSVKIVKKRRKLHGRVFYYELEKLY
jgi:methyltransferase OMS1